MTPESVWPHSGFPEDPDLSADELTVLGQYLRLPPGHLGHEVRPAQRGRSQAPGRSQLQPTLLGPRTGRHLTEVEYGWFCEWLDGQPEKSVHCPTTTQWGPTIRIPTRSLTSMALLRPGLQSPAHSLP